MEGLIRQSDPKFDVKYDDLGQYGRRDNIRFYGIKEGEHVEDTNKITLDVLSNLDLYISLMIFAALIVLEENQVTQPNHTK